ncbi:ABC transporter ATP-binding protein [Tistrella bauzanensis]|uniref:ABC transporter ATP-binding protein n=1 Tax=Tistrella TaxID=171436 RepID=UPI0031F6B342
MTEIVLAVEHLRKSYGPVEAVGDLNFTVGAGETVALLGGNGAGKTTAMSMILGVVTPSAGRVWLFGRDATRDRRHALPRMNFSSPYVDLPHRLSVRQNLDTYARLYGIRRPGQRVREISAAFDLNALLDRPTGRLSAGQKTRVSLAKAMLNSPDLLLLDEPTASLDPDTGDRLRGLLERFRDLSGAAILLASHNMGEVERLAHRVLMMRAGRVVDDGTPAELLARYGRSSLEDVFLDVARAEDA